MNENKRDKFKRLATIRTNNVLKNISLIGNLSNKNNYEYTDEEVNKIFYALENQLKVAKAKFKGSKKREFKL